MTLAEFRTLFLEWLNRSDCTSAKADTFIAQAYGRINRDLRRLATSKVTVDAEADEDDGAFKALPRPAGFLSMDYVLANGEITVTPTTFDALLALPAAIGTPSRYCEIDGVFQVRPWAESSLRFSYFGRATVPASAATDDLLTNHHTVVLWAALSYAGSFYSMDERSEWEARYQEEKAALTDASLDQEASGPQAVSPPPGTEVYL
jgi:hypothetical protein